MERSFCYCGAFAGEQCRAGPIHLRLWRPQPFASIPIAARFRFQASTIIPGARPNLARRTTIATILATGRAGVAAGRQDQAADRARCCGSRTGRASAVPAAPGSARRTRPRLRPPEPSTATVDRAPAADPVRRQRRAAKPAAGRPQVQQERLPRQTCRCRGNAAACNATAAHRAANSPLASG